MKPAQRLTAVIEREESGFVALCPELDIASEGESIEEARANLIEALTLFFETASASELRRGTLMSIIRQSELPRSIFENEN